MKDAFMPIVLTVIVIIVAVFFIMRIYTPQKQTVNALAESSEQAQTSVVALADEDGSEATGTMVKALYEKYDGTYVDVDIYDTNGSTEIDVDNVKADEIYTKTVTRSEKDMKMTDIKFVKK
ncbi:MAG TPA: hypothetical protein DEP72_04605 [Clostridiales bacterium]|nr:MAG: hypothetical protein A2Y18_05400 [Clostridiales bacterium GWD2_32_19]HCC07423.1 hypothetical protein [Clostridiales bacterium]